MGLLAVKLRRYSSGVICVSRSSLALIKQCGFPNSNGIPSQVRVRSASEMFGRLVTDFGTANYCAKYKWCVDAWVKAYRSGTHEGISGSVGSTPGELSVPAIWRHSSEPSARIMCLAAAK